MYERYYPQLTALELKLVAPLDHGSLMLTDPILRELGYQPTHDDFQRLSALKSRLNIKVSDELRLTVVQDGSLERLLPVLAPQCYLAVILDPRNW